LIPSLYLLDSLLQENLNNIIKGGYHLYKKYIIKNIYHWYQEHTTTPSS